MNYPKVDQFNNKTIEYQQQQKTHSHNSKLQFTKLANKLNSIVNCPVNWPQARPDKMYDNSVIQILKHQKFIF